MRRITEIGAYKGSTLRIDFEEGEPEFINRDVAAECGLRKGLELTDDVWEKVIYKNDFRRAKERALYLLDVKDHSYVMLFKRLEENYPEQICYDVCDRLAELGLINDRRFASLCARHYMEIKKFGRFRAVQEMRLKGLTQSLIDEALAPYDDSDSTKERIKELIAKKYIRRLEDEDGVKKVKNALVRQGYSYSDINAAMDEFLEELEDE